MSDPKRIHFCHVPETEDRIVCLSCERFVNHYFCEHCGSVDLDVIEVPVEAKPLPKFADRLRHVQVECDDWRGILERYDRTEVTFYLDPPYLPSTRRSGSYAHELSEDDHAEFVERVQALQASVVVSGYDSPLYSALDSTFERFEFEVHLAAAKTIDTQRDRRTEVVWVRSNGADRLFTFSESSCS